MRRLLSVLSGVLALALTLPATASASTSAWPRYGQASYALGAAPWQWSVHQHEVPIASVAKVMTAYLVLRHEALPHGRNGFRMTVRSSDVADYWRRVNRGESTVAVRVGEVITERQAMAALLLPSANNIAIMLARKVSGSVAAFVHWMNTTAHRLRMRHTTYTDPSGFDANTRSTATDQLRLATAIGSHHPFLRWLVSLRSFRVPVAGTVYNTDRLLGTDGFIGTKTGSMSASGGCFMFRSHRIVRGHRVDMIGVVLGQPGGDLVWTGQAAAKRLVDRVAPRAG